MAIRAVMRAVICACCMGRPLTCPKGLNRSAVRGTGVSCTVLVGPAAAGTDDAGVADDALAMTRLLPGARRARGSGRTGTACMWASPVPLDRLQILCRWSIVEGVRLASALPSPSGTVLSSVDLCGSVLHLLQFAH